ncbi:glucokinase [Thioclava sp. A2]|uniref:glucokinase n=1 Tax=Thioclava sp. FCG-A2 TaxID=3080562 RepID=UPI0029534FB2|nr:glucokinase [Thioclava sp. A2]MDV7269779.1 glucokinase [Thioclava sp. A2]
MANPETYDLVVDIGGTNTRVALAHEGQIIDASIKRYRNADHAGLDLVLRDYLAQSGDVAVNGACVAVAGPVAVDGTSAAMTNLAWAIETETIRAATGAARVALLNDLQAQGHAIGHLPEGSVRVLFQGRPAPARASALVVGVGTGFNAAPVHETAHGRIVLPSECGHVTLPAVTEDDIALLRHIEEKHVFASVEHALSGRGFERIHAYVTDKTEIEEDAATIMAALEAGDASARRTGRIFARVLGMVVGDLALTHLPFGGIFLCGGVARAFAPWLEGLGFRSAFTDKGRFAGFMEQFSVATIEDDYAALTGSARFLHGMSH